MTMTIEVTMTGRTTIVWTSVVSAALFLALKHTIGLRPSAEVEHEGLCGSCWVPHQLLRQKLRPA